MLQRSCYALFFAFCLLLAPSEVVLGQATGTISGVVTDSVSGQTIPGANVLIVGTQQGTTTDEEGNYSLEIEPGTYDLRVSFVGYATETRRNVEVEANQRTQLDFRLVQSGVQLEEVVAVGYTQQRSQDVTGSVSTVSSGDIEDLPVTGVDQALQGQVSGVQINQGSIRVPGSPAEGRRSECEGLGPSGREPSRCTWSTGLPYPLRPVR